MVNSVNLFCVKITTELGKSNNSYKKIPKSTSEILLEYFIRFLDNIKII